MASVYNFPKAVFGISQSLAAGYTLYRAREDQLSRYGWTAFALTVTSYLVMSVLNCLAEVLTPHYPTCYLIQSDTMSEAERREQADVFFDGMIGRLVPLETSEAIESTKEEQDRVPAENQFSEWKVIGERDDRFCLILRHIPRTDTTASPSDQCEAHGTGSLPGLLLSMQSPSVGYCEIEDHDDRDLNAIFLACDYSPQKPKKSTNERADDRIW